ncbi:Ig-like domain-containing protein [Gemmata sp. JC673]|uniref:Ig-like domain-containing protein n=1 Tax=Gemmata algarum TaxID=2975278 RepID=A0ABU5EZK1_9BACT|nr:Ig-like domain-containing protein [Gemmata algarum]MDY3560348.1 Ig-like domain-containing protein [Gemmata algarum]
MDRNAGTIVLCLVLGAAVMYVSTNYRFHVEPVAPPAQVTHAPPGADPRLLPTEVTRPRPADAAMQDPRMRPIGAVLAAPPSFGIAVVEDGEVRFPVAALKTEYRVFNKKVDLVLDSDFNADELHFRTKTTPLTKAQDKDTAVTMTKRANGSTVATVDLSALADKTTGALALELIARNAAPMGGDSPPAAIALRAAGAGGGAQGLTPLKATNSTYRSTADLSGAVPLYARDGVVPYLKLSGSKDEAARLAFFLQPAPATGTAVELVPEFGAKLSGQNWEAGFKPERRLDGSTAKVVVRAVDANGRFYAEQTVNVVFRDLTAALAAPRLVFPLTLPAPPATANTTIPGRAAAVPIAAPNLPAYFTNATSFVLKAEATEDVEAFVHYVGGDMKLIGTTGFPGTGSFTTGQQTTFDIKNLTPGHHVIGVAAVRGLAIGPVAQVKVLVETQPPVVDEARAAPGFGQTPGATDKITVRFNHKMDPDTIKAEAFDLIHNENKGAQTVRIRSAQLDAQGDTVTLNVTDVVSGTYTLSIVKAKPPKDVYGNDLAQAPVLDEKKLYETILSTQGGAAGGAPGAGQSSRTVGITHKTGKPVEFPDYVKFRVSPDGFNPSDRVETRVMRLYYYRDAHRVAQLINRTVKSYNAATVDIRRRTADAVRDNADKAEDDRKALEAEAVRAAQEARAAEAEVNNLQNGIATARNQSATARIDLLQRQQELEQAKRDLARAELLTPGRTNNDTALEEQRQLLEALDRDLFRVDTALKAPNLADPDKLQLEIRKREIQTRVATEKRTFDRLLVENQTRADSGADTARARVKALEVEIGKLQSVSTTGDLVERANADRLTAAQSALAGKRESEAKAVEAWQVKELQERRLRENQFRTETAAAREDPDTYAPGNPNSVDAVMQVSVSVIGEGLIQLRGPIKGLNVIRTMVNQIDAPVGQVRVAVHTLQVNGERADRMEKVVANIQRYLDHSRFLTAQSGQMLRNAVTSVASRKAAEVQATLAPGCTQWDRDQRYLYSFFGKDFIDELIQLDSEFLKTGNKLLSLNSMDSTSLSSALFLLALAKNDVRTEIITEFLATVQRDLPEAEWKYYVAGISQPKHCDACKDKKQYLLANNSQFQSLVGFFSAQLTGNDTLNPLQREFVKLAQIFKARMVTEMQLRQRVMERALLEERVGTKYLEELKKAKDLEDAAKEELKGVEKERQNAAQLVSESLVNVLAEFDIFQTEIEAFGDLDVELPQLEKKAAEVIQSRQFLAAIAGSANDLKLPILDINIGKQLNITNPNDIVGVTVIRYAGVLRTAQLDGTRLKLVSAQWDPVLRRWKNLYDQMRQLVFTGERAKDHAEYIKLLEQITTSTPTIEIGQLKRLGKLHKELTASILEKLSEARNQAGQLIEEIRNGKIDPLVQRANYEAFKADILGRIKEDRLTNARRAFSGSDAAFQTFGAAEFRYQASRKNAQNARRPLDEKKLLDMLVDEMEDKFVEILEGTRAHTSNVDNYLKSIATALDDDFNTQYYLPSFQRARTASRSWDVTLSQIETTSVLTNNRALGKVSPAATFEFDLPKRDILITEGFKTAKAMFDEYGALMNDPSFLALAKIYSGNPVSMMQGAGGGLSAVRNVLPGLPTSADEKILAQAGPGRREFGAALDGLIPDPAIYKFETGTGYEIRPVLSPDGQAVVFGFDYMYTTDVREPVRADEKHLGRVKRHFVSTDVQLGNYELREVSKYMVAIKAARTAKGVQLLQDIPGVGALFRPLPSAAASLQQNLIYSQATIFPTLFDLMGLRYAPAVADLDPLADRMAEFAARYRRLDVEQRIYDIGATRVDDALRTPYGERRYDLYRPPMSLPFVHPNGYTGLGLRLYDGTLREGYDVNGTFPDSRFAPRTSPEGMSKPFNFGGPGQPALDVSPGYGPLPPNFVPENAFPRANPALPLPAPTPVPGARWTATPTVPNTTVGSPNTMRLPGMGSVGVGRQVPYNPALSTTPPPLRPAELPTTGGQTTVTTNPPPVPRPSIPTPSMPQPAGLLPSSPLGNR